MGQNCAAVTSSPQTAYSISSVESVEGARCFDPVMGVFQVDDRAENVLLGANKVVVVPSDVLLSSIFSSNLTGTMIFRGSCTFCFKAAFHR